MTAQLAFTLCAPYGAWGAASLSSATTAYKATELDPPKSALVGLLAAALGLERAGLAALAQSVLVAVRVGVRPERDPKPDYHTITRAAPPEGRDRWTRFEELRAHLAGRGESGSLLSRREYWACGLWTVAVVVAADAPWSADLLAQALRAPRWTLYAGRKSCTLGLPPDPEVIVDAGGPMAALGRYGWPWERHPGLAAVLEPLRDRLEHPDAQDLIFDPDYPGAPQGDDGHTVRTTRRRDRPDPLVLDGGRIYQRFHERTEARTGWRTLP